MQVSPRPLGEILAEGMNTLARTWRTLLVPALGAAIPLGVATLLTFRLTGANEFLDLLFNNPSQLDALPDDEFAALSVSFLSAAFISIALQAVAAAFIGLATHRVVGSTLAKETISGGTAARFALGKLLPLLIAWLIASMGIAAGLILLVVPGIWLAGMVSMITPVMALEDSDILGSLRRSFDLVRGRWWQTIGFLLFVGLIGSVAAQMVQLVAIPLASVSDLSTSAALSFVVGTLVQGALIAAIAVMTTMWYLDLRARKEPVFTESLG